MRVSLRFLKHSFWKYLGVALVISALAVGIFHTHHDFSPHADCDVCAIAQTTSEGSFGYLLANPLFFLLLHGLALTSVFVFLQLSFSRTSRAPPFLIF